jgi:hypothetical protein
MRGLRRGRDAFQCNGHPCAVARWLLTCGLRLGQGLGCRSCTFFLDNDFTVHHGPAHLERFDQIFRRRLHGQVPHVQLHTPRNNAPGLVMAMVPELVHSNEALQLGQPEPRVPAC